MPSFNLGPKMVKLDYKKSAKELSRYYRTENMWRKINNFVVSFGFT